MKNSAFTKLPALCAALLLAACGAPASERPASSATAEDASPPQAVEPSATPTQTPEPPQPAEQAGPLYWVDAQNSAGRYEAEWDYNTDTVVARYLDFNTATEQIVGEPLELPYGNAYLFADDEFLYWTWSGMVNDTPILLRSNLDGSGRVPLYEFRQGASLGMDTARGFASDGRNLYFPYSQISDDPAVPDRFFLARLDTETQTLEMILEWEPFVGNLFGVWNDCLLITHTVLDEDCPLEPVYGHYYIENMEELEPWQTTYLCALDPATGEEEVLYECPGTWLDRRVADGALWRSDKDNRLLCKPLDQPEEFTVLQTSLPAYPYAIYTEDILLSATDEAGKDLLYLYDRTTGSLTSSPRRRWMGGEDRAISVLCEAGQGQYVVIDDASAGMQAIADADGNQYLIDGYARYAIASRDALLDESIPLTPVTRPGAA